MSVDYKKIALLMSMIYSIANAGDLCYKLENDIISSEDLLKDIDVTIELSKDIMKEDYFSITSGLKNKLPDNNVYEFLENAQYFQQALNKKKDVLVSLSKLYDKTDSLCSMDKIDKSSIVRDAISNIENQIKTSEYRVKSIKRDIIRYKRENIE